MRVMDKNKFSESRIYNVDETGISTVQKPVKVYAPKGQKQVGSAISWERGKTVTVVCSVSAAGHYIPPMFIFPRQRLNPSLAKNGPPGAIYHCSKNGWINEGLFLEWISHFCKNVKPTPEDPILLVLDNHSSHTSLEVYNYCKEHGIVMLSLPPHSSHRMQPLDLTVYGPLKNAFNRECDLFMKTHQHQKITHYDLAEIFCKAYIKVATIDKGISGFQAAGIWPLNPDKFSEDDFCPTLENTPTLQHPQVDLNATMKLNDGTATIEIENDTNIVTPEKNDENLQNANQNETREPQPGPSRDCVINSDSSPLRTKLEKLAPIPRLVLKPVNNSRTKMHSEILTSTPLKEQLEIAREKRKQKEETKQKRIKGTKESKKKHKRKENCPLMEKHRNQHLRNHAM